MVSSTREGRHFAWAGVELGRLRLPPTAARLDPDGAADAAVENLLRLLDPPDVTTTIELRFQRDPTRPGLTAAALARVDGTERRWVDDHLTGVVEALSGYELAETNVLGSDRLMWWLGRSIQPPRWSYLARRLVQRTRGPGPVEPFWSRIETSNVSWDRVLDELFVLPPGTSLGVRLRREVDPSSDVRELDRILQTLRPWSRPAWDSQAGVLGEVRERQASPVAAQAIAALEQVRSHWSERRYRFDFGWCGSGSQGALNHWISSLAPRFGAHASALEVVDVDPSEPFGFWHAHQSLDHVPSATVSKPHHPASRLIRSLDEGEARSLIHLPRAGASPTPGFAVQTEPHTGIPDVPFVFVSYNRVDIDLAHRMAALFQDWGISTWWDARIVSGTDWSDELHRAIGGPSCRAVVVLVTERTALSEWVRRETAVAVERGVPVIQVRLRTAPPLDDRWQIIDLTGWTGSPADGRLELLERDVRAQLAR